ncbi:MAG: 50S ribosomal protein L9 [Phycisphaerae bacterium]|nr:50S ribosomal protein L9 [Phycisphaerae bacterium]
MKVLLNQDIPTLGQIGDVVTVSPGYARNYLLPQRLASEPTAANMKRLEAEKARVEAERIKRREAMEAMAARLQGKEITLTRMANEVGHLYGSVSGKDVAEALAAEGLPVQASEVLIREPIRTLDKYEVDIRLAADLNATIQLWIVPEKGALPLDGQSAPAAPAVEGDAAAETKSE